MNPVSKDEGRLGFLTAIEVPERGFVAGLLVTNRYSRPLEFQCTTPVKPNRTQELLYGPTLETFIMGELLAKTLVEKINVKPQLILTDREEILEVRSHISIPVAHVHEVPDEENVQESQERIDASDVRPSCQIGSHVFRFHAAHRDDGPVVQKQRDWLCAVADLGEPLERVRDALKETMNVAAGGGR